MNKKLCLRLKELREDKKLSQTKLGLILNVNQQAVDHWEHGRSEPKNDTLIQLAQLYQVTTDYLLGLSDKK